MSGAESSDCIVLPVIGVVSAVLAAETKGGEVMLETIVKNDAGAPMRLALRIHDLDELAEALGLVDAGVARRIELVAPS